MLTAGNAIGTWVSTLPLRSCSGASTSQISGSCRALPGTVDDALAKMRGLLGGQWEPCEVWRGQERLGWADVIRMHGFVIVKLHNKDARTLMKFMRLDWGHDGFAFQTAASDDAFHSYSGFEDGASAKLPGSLMEALAQVAPYTRRVYEHCGPTASMKKLIDAIDAKKNTAYDLATWNCNHFANLIVEVLTENITV